MKKPAPTYRLAALALLLSFVLGAALPALCPRDAMAAEHSGMAGAPPAAPCAAPRHAFSGQAVQGPETPVAVVQRAPAAGPEVLSPAPPAAAAATPVARRSAAGTRLQPVPVRAGPPPIPRTVRLHVSNAVFLN